jgi:hypothetical protein
MFNTLSTTLDPQTLHQTFQGVSPFILSIDPRLTETSKKTYKIVYDFNDGTPVLVKNLQPSPGDSDSSLIYPYEIRDPRNEVISHTFILHNTTSKTYNINIKVFSVINESIKDNYTEYTISLHLKAPYLNTSSIATSGNFFEDIHLVNTRMFDYDNTILYNFESVNPFYLLPTIVRWHETYDDTNPPPFLFDPDYSPRGRYPR